MTSIGLPIIAESETAVLRICPPPSPYEPSIFSMENSLAPIQMKHKALSLRLKSAILMMGLMKTLQLIIKTGELRSHFMA
jgi:hypothetical protein